jgi:hypothetical protein
MFDRGDSSLECLIEETTALNVSTESLISMDRGSRFQLDIVRGKYDSCLCGVVQRRIMEGEEWMCRDCLRDVLRLSFSH